MASRGGPRAAGTDGGDFEHREIIKNHYQVRNGVHHAPPHVPPRRQQPRFQYADQSDDYGVSYYRKAGAAPAVFNNDPGVNDSDDEDAMLEMAASHRKRFATYTDSQAVMNEIAAKAREIRAGADEAAAAALAAKDHTEAAVDEDLPLTGDYRGMGGPESVPLATLGAFEPPPRPQSSMEGGSILSAPKKQCILDELFLSPTEEQLKAFQRIERRKLNATNKSRLKWGTGCHLLLFLLVCAKLVPELLDRLDIFVLELEELFIPRAHFWEFWWLVSLPFTFLATAACRRSNVPSMAKFMTGIVIFGLMPIISGMIVHFPDLYTYLTAANKSAVAEDLLMWKGFPVAVLWYSFFIVAIQVHSAEIYFANVLIQAWKPKRKAN